MLIANTQLRNLAAGEGDTFHRVILSYPRRSTYTPGSDITFSTLSSSDASLSIATWFESSVRVDDTEKRQSIVDIGKEAARRIMKNHNNSIEQAVLYQVYNATHLLDDGNIGGTDGNRAIVNTSTVPQLFTAADVLLDSVDAPRNGRVAVFGGHILQQLRLQQAGRATNFGDVVNARGEIGQLFGWRLIYNNNLPYNARLTISTNPTAADTVTVAGVVFTFNTAIGTTAGSIVIGGTANASALYFAAAINDSNTAATGLRDSQYVDISSDNRFLLQDKRRIVATYSGTTVDISGFGDIVVSETLTAAANVWSRREQNALFCSVGSVHQIVQIPPVLEVARDPDQFADIVKSLLGYGVQTFADGAREMVRVQVDAGQTDWS